MVDIVEIQTKRMNVGATYGVAPPGNVRPVASLNIGVWVNQCRIWYVSCKCGGTQSSSILRVLDPPSRSFYAESKINLLLFKIKPPFRATRLAKFMNVPKFVNIDRVVLSYTHCKHIYRFLESLFGAQWTLKIFPLKFDFLWSLYYFLYGWERIVMWKGKNLTLTNSVIW